MPPRDDLKCVSKNQSFIDNNSIDETASRFEETKFKSTEAKIVWKNVALHALIHLGAAYGVYCCFHAKYQTLAFGKKLFHFSLEKIDKK